MPVNEDVLSKIKACLNLAGANSNTTEAEMTAALGMARRLMAQHNLSEAEVLAHDPGASTEDVNEVTVETRLHPHSYEKNLAMVMKSLFSVEPLVFGTIINGKPRRVIKFYGLPTDIAVAAAAYKLLRDEINQMALRSEFKEMERDHWRVGVVHRLRDRANVMASGLSKEGDVKCRDLVIIKNQMIKKHIAENVGDTKTGRTRTTMDDAYDAGKRAGDSVNLDFRGQVGGGGSRSALRLGHH